MAAAYQRSSGEKANKQLYGNNREALQRAWSGFLDEVKVGEEEEGEETYSSLRKGLTAQGGRRRTGLLVDEEEETATLAKRLTYPSRRTSLSHVSNEWQRLLLKIAVAGSLLFAIFFILEGALSWGRVRLDDFRYGRPRTYQLDAFVGHGENPGQPTHLIALNLNRRVTIIEIPGGDASKMRTIQGPYLFGKNEDLTPLKLTVRDLNNDNKGDLIVEIKNEQLIFINTGDSFRLITAAEREALQGGGK